MIVTNEKILRLPCSDALPVEVGEIIELLERELRHSNMMGRFGIGLAASQCNIQKRVAIVRIGESKIDLVNANIAHGYDEKMFRDEGCLSFPDRLENTMRFQEIHISNNLVAPNGMVLTGLLAICAAHELDHTNGILLPDRAIPKPSKLIKPSPNEKCFCGSNIKYKKCCRLKNL